MMKNKLRSKRMRELSFANVFDSNLTFKLSTTAETESAFYSAFINAPAQQLCFYNIFTQLSLEDRKDQLIPSKETFFTYTSNNNIRSIGYNDSWEFPYGVKLGVKGYFIFKVENEWTYYEDGNRWISNCDLSGRNRLGKGSYVIVSTSRHINMLNDPDSTALLGPVSKWVINTLGADTIDKQKKQFPKLLFPDEEPIFFIEPSPSPLTFPSEITVSRSNYLQNVKIIEIIRSYIQNSSNIVPTSDFTITWFTSSNPDIAQIPSGLYSQRDTITFLNTGTFTLSGYRYFYQSYTRGVSYLKEKFDIKIIVTQ